MTNEFKKYRMTRKNVLLLAQAIINVDGQIAWSSYSSDEAFADNYTMKLEDIKNTPSKFKMFKDEFSHRMFSDVINTEMQNLEDEK